MKFTTALFAAAALAAPFAIAPVSAFDPDQEKVEAQEDEADGEIAREKAKTEAKAENKVICRHVRLDTSSRRKTKVCRTKEGWRELNNPR